MRRITIVLGGFELLRLEAPVSVGVCDDTSIVRVEDGGDALRLVGLKVGKTQCGFWTQQRTGQHTMVEVIVTTAPPRKH